MWDSKQSRQHWFYLQVHLGNEDIQISVNKHNIREREDWPVFVRTWYNPLEVEHEEQSV